MEIVKKILSFLIGFVLMILISVLLSSFLLKNIIQNQLIGSIVRTEMLSDFIDESDIENKEEINKLLDDDELNNIVNNMIDDYLNSVDDENYIVSEKTVNAIINYIVEHEEEIEKITDTEIDIDEIKSQESYDELTNTLNDALGETNNLGSSEKNILKTYAYLTSNRFRITLLVSIVVLIVLLALIKKSTYEWLSTASISLISSGVLLCLIYTALKFLIISLLKEENISITVDPKDMLIVGLLEIVLGIVLKLLKSTIESKKQAQLLEDGNLEERKEL